MNEKLKRPVMLVVVLIWLLLMIFPVFAFVLANRGQIQIGEPSGSSFRVFLLQDSDAQGIGLEWTRNIGPDQACRRTSVNYLLWEGGTGARNVSFCQCINPDSGLMEMAPDCGQR